MYSSYNLSVYPFLNMVLEIQFPISSLHLPRILYLATRNLLLRSRRSLEAPTITHN